MTAVKKIDKTVNRDTLETDLRELCLIVRPSWKDEEINFKKLPGGLINDIYKCTVLSDTKENEAIIIRLYSTQDVCGVIDRNRELYGMQVGQAAGVAEPLYLIFNNGLVYGYAPGELGYWGMLWDDTIARSYMRMLARYHSVHIAKLQLVSTDGTLTTLIPKLDTFESLRGALQNIPKKYVNFPERQERVEKSLWSVQRIKEEIDALENFFEKFNFDVVFSHLDAWVWNVIYDKETGKISLIDFEFANFNYEAADLSSLFNGIGMFEVYNRLLPPSMNTTQEELALPRTTERKRKLSRMYMEEKCIMQGKSIGDFTEQEYEKFHNQAEMLAIFINFSLCVFLMTQFDDPEVPWDCVTFAEIIHGKYLELRELLFSYKPS